MKLLENKPMLEKAHEELSKRPLNPTGDGGLMMRDAAKVVYNASGHLGVYFDVLFLAELHCGDEVVVLRALCGFYSGTVARRGCMETP